ncbi:MAG: diguanylate cyclase [Nitriliruptor sp.]|nr:MAG: diguanylate cyclase [Nitriliruptor sp.]
MTIDFPAVGDGPSADDVPDGRDWDTAARVARLLEVVQRFANLDFSEAAPVGLTGDDLDAVAAGINMLGEELEGWNADFIERVDQRTAQLTAATERLEAEAAQRRRTEEQLAQANVELTDKVGELQRLNTQIVQLTEMSNLLQAAGDPEEAFDVAVRFAPEVFPGARGAIYVATSSGAVLELVRTWGPQEAMSPSFAADGCIALRQGSVHHGQDVEDNLCSHLPPGNDGHALCLPLTAQGEVLGLLSLYWEHDPALMAAGPQDNRDQPAGLETRRLALAAAEQFALTLANLALRTELRTQSIRDALTGLYNRRYLDETLARELHRAQRADLPVSVLMLDIDHFKEFNDTYGHAAGDTVLAEVARILLDSIRSGDIACRYGGEEFAVIMTGADQVAATARAEHLRTSIARHAFPGQGEPSSHLTVSLGVATRPQHGTSPDDLLHSADTALYRAKERGRNRVATAS